VSSIAGTVTGVAAGLDPSLSTTCVPSNALASASWLEITSADGAKIRLTMPPTSVALPFAVGDSVQVDADVETTVYSLVTVSFTVRDPAGTLLMSYADRSKQPPEITAVTVLAPTCETFADGRGLVSPLAITAFGESGVLLPTNAPLSLGGYSLFHSAPSEVAFLLPREDGPTTAEDPILVVKQGD
jgi:hypothetical protein